MKVPSWQFVQFSQVEISNILDGNGQYKSSEVNGQTAYEVGTIQWPINPGSLNIKLRLQTEITSLPEIVGKGNQEADLLNAQGKLIRLIKYKRTNNQMLLRI